MARNFKDYVKQKKKQPVFYDQMFVGFINKPNVPKNKLFVGFIGKKGKSSTKKEIKEELDSKEELKHSSLGISLQQHYSNWSLKHIDKINNYTSDLHEPLNHYLYSSAGRGLGKKKFDEKEIGNLKKHDELLSDALKQHKTPHDLTVYSGVKKSPEHIKPQGGYIHIENPGYTSTSIRKSVADGFSVPDMDSKHSYLRSYRKGGGGFKNMIKSTLGMMSHHELNHPKIDYAKPHKLTAMSHDDYDHRVTGVEKQYKINNWNNLKDHINKHFSKLTGLSHSKYKHDHSVYQHVMKIHVPAGSHGGYIAHHSDFPHENEFLLHKNAKLKIHQTPELDHKNSIVLWHAHLVHDGVNNVGA